MKLTDESLMPIGAPKFQKMKMVELPNSYLRFWEGKLEGREYLTSNERAVLNYIIENKDVIFP